MKIRSLAAGTWILASTSQYPVAFEGTSAESNLECRRIKVLLFLAVSRTRLCGIL